MGLAGKGFRNRYHTTNLGWDEKGQKCLQRQLMCRQYEQTSMILTGEQ